MFTVDWRGAGAVATAERAISNESQRVIPPLLPHSTPKGALEGSAISRVPPSWCVLRETAEVAPNCVFRVNATGAALATVAFRVEVPTFAPAKVGGVAKPARS
jgi:hypothetical protein